MLGCCYSKAVFGVLAQGIGIRLSNGVTRVQSSWCKACHKDVLQPDDA